MPYSAPVRWSHGDYVDSASMQVYSDDLNAMRPMLAVQRISWGVPFSTMPEAQTFWLVRKRRWLIYKSTGEIVDHLGVQKSVSLSDSDEINVFDLDTVKWLFPGMLYKVVGCSVAFEDENGVLVSTYA